MLTIRFQGPAEAVEKLKASQDKIKAKVLAKLPSAHSAQVILRDKPVNASSGAFYGGFIYGEDKEGKKVKCGEVRVKTSSLGKATPSREVKKVEKPSRTSSGVKPKEGEVDIDELLKSKDFSIAIRKFFVKTLESHRSDRDRGRVVTLNTHNLYANPTRKGKYINVKLKIEYWVEGRDVALTKDKADAAAFSLCRWSFRRGSSFTEGEHTLVLSNFNITKTKAMKAGSGYYDVDYIVDVIVDVDFKIS